MDASLAARLQRLEDIEAIARLKARYCQACDDDHNPDKVAACFIPDGLWEGRNIGVHARGHEAIRRYIGGVKDSGRIRTSAHIVTNPLITIDGDEAVGAWRLVMLYTGVAPDGAEQFHRIIGFYEDRFVRTEDGWRFASLGVTVEAAGAYSVEDSRLI